MVSTPLLKNPLPSISRVYTEQGSLCLEFDKDNHIKCEKSTTVFVLEQQSPLFPGHYEMLSLSYLFPTAHYIL